MALLAMHRLTSDDPSSAPPRAQLATTTRVSQESAFQRVPNLNSIVKLPEKSKERIWKMNRLYAGPAKSASEMGQNTLTQGQALRHRTAK